MSDEDTSANDRGASRREITERKVKPGGSVREFSCELVHLETHLAVIRYVITTPSAFPLPIAMTPGAVSDGWFWPRRPYSIYRIRSAEGALLGHRFDAVADVRISEDAIEYRDLILDWWVLPDGSILEEDRDELEDLVASGDIAPDVHADALRAAGTVLGRYRHILDELARTERKLGLWGGGGA